MGRRYFILVPFILFIAIELILRFVFGFCDVVLMKEDPDYEYIAAPNQKRFRFLNNIYYNSLSMRSREIDPKAQKILFFGDSVVNGGVLTDQAEMATTILEDSLSKFYKSNIQTLNVSAGSWGPDNAFAYLKKSGNFNAKKIILIVGSHDAYDNRNFEKVVDVIDGFSTKQYDWAILELFDRYLLPKMGYQKARKSSNVDELGINKRQPSSAFNSGFQSFYEYTAKEKIPFIIYLHAEIPEMLAGKYNEQGKEIIEFAEKNKITLIKDLDYQPTKDDYRDIIHLSEKGQLKMAHNLLPFLEKD